jgi:ElaB/YqjD/DUF883 family membrane-anchored ribosome-binding protein
MSSHDPSIMSDEEAMRRLENMVVSLEKLLDDPDPGAAGKKIVNEKDSELAKDRARNRLSIALDVLAVRKAQQALKRQASEAVTRLPWQNLGLGGKL